MRKKTSLIWKIDTSELKQIVNNSSSLAQILKYFNLMNKGGNCKTLKKRLEYDNINYSHIPLGMNSNKGRKFPLAKAIPLAKIMVENSTYSRHWLKKRLIKDKILENKCDICRLETEWNNIKLVMVLDHINGVSNDNRKENLRLLCPNCNSQQDTFAGRKNKKKHYCEICGKEKKWKKFKLCRNCASIKNRKVKNRPSKEQLLEEIEETNYCAVGRKYGVSDRAVRKWLK